MAFTSAPPPCYSITASSRLTTTGLVTVSADESQTTVRNSVFYNPDGQDIYWMSPGEEPRLDENGNITADPMFVDREGGNYALSPGSPAIDAARAVTAPSRDILGRPRYDDTGMANIGSGFPAYVDIGAFERHEDSATADLAVTGVSRPDPEAVSAGDSVTIEWTVRNIGLVAATGTWQDLIYLSRRPLSGR